MREALMALGARREQPASRQAAEPQRMAMHRSGGDRAAASGHRHRFVQDGEVPVVLVSNGNGGGARPSEPRSHGGRPAPTAADLGAERAARERAERALAQTQALVRDLETKIAHAEMARADAINAAKAAKEALATLRSQSVNEVQRLNGLLNEERAARKKAEQRTERALAAATASSGEVRVKRAYTKRKRYPLADLSDITGDLALAAAAELEAPDLAAEPEAATPMPTAAAPQSRTPAPTRRAKAEAKAARVKKVAEPKPVKWWVKGRAKS